jgi:hypothetical protein
MQMLAQKLGRFAGLAFTGSFFQRFGVLTLLFMLVATIAGRQLFRSLGTSGGLVSITLGSMFSALFVAVLSWIIRLPGRLIKQRIDAKEKAARR